MSLFERSDGVQRLVHFLPVIGVLTIIISTWLAFVFAVSVNEVLLHRKDVPYFVFQVVLFHILLGLTLMSYVAVVAHRPLAPDLSLAPPDARPLPGYEEWDDAPAPENTLLEGVPPPASLAPVARAPPSTPAPPSAPPIAAHPSATDDDDIPLRLLRTSPQSAEPDVPIAQVPVRDMPAEDLPPIEEEDETEGLLSGAFDGPIAIMAKSNTGGPRWCRKCDAWKPDRCHHCRSCRQCVLKMDHHCPWVANCIGYHNYKFFILFVTYAALLSAFGASQAGLEAYRFFQDPSRYDGGSYPENDMEALQLTFTPVLFLLLAIIGGCLTLALGGLSAYHWYLLLNNRTTLENVDRSPATALLDSQTRATLEALGPRGSRQRIPGAWRPDHILTRPERTRLRREAREINVYDVGWRNNVRQVMCGDATEPATSWKGWLREVGRAAWPLSRPRMVKYGRGHVFKHDRAALRELKALTREVRLGLGRDGSEAGGGYAGGGYGGHGGYGGYGGYGDHAEDTGTDSSSTSISDESDRVPPYRRYE